MQYLLSWINLLKTKYGCGEDDYIFPTIQNHFDNSLFHNKTTTKKNMKVNTIRGVFKRIFISAELEYINPHNFRHTIARTASLVDISRNQDIALELNLGHTSKRTVERSYGDNSIAFQSRHIKSILFHKLTSNEN